MNVADLVVLGGGPSGTATAITAARRGLQVLLLDPVGGSRAKVGESLPPVANRYLRRLGIEPESLAEHGHVPNYGTRSAWGGTDLVERDHLLDPDGHGWILDRNAFDAQLRKVAQAAGVQVLEGRRIRSLQRVGDGWQLDIDGDECTASWMVDASGRARVIARMIGEPVQRRDELVAFSLRAPARPGDTDRRLCTESCPLGWWYTTLTPGGDRAVLLVTDASSAMAGLALDREKLREWLGKTRHIHPLFDCQQATGPGLHRAESTRLQRFSGPGWMAVGDAAAALDPISSQGILHALHTGERAGDAVADALAGSDEARLRYEEELERLDAAYVQNRTLVYAAERRWPDEPFWQRRSVKSSGRTDQSLRPAAVGAP